LKINTPGEIIIPPQYIAIEGPVIFLAGPIQGATDWQNEAARFIKSEAQEVHIASPRRPEFNKGDFVGDKHKEQVDWEHFYLQRAGENGVILFWLAKEQEHSCDRAYAQTTRFELGEAVAKHHFANIKVIVGIEDGFTNANYLRITLSKKYPGIPICNNLQETCKTAIQYILSEKECICVKDCDCQNPPPDDWDGGEDSVYHISNECPVHNRNPRPNPECLFHGSKK